MTNVTEELEDIYQRIAGIDARFNEQLQPPCPEYKITQLRREAWDAFHIEIPAGYLNFLCRMNGLDFNGTLFYGAQREPYVHKPSMSLQGFMETNIIARESDDQLLWFGESGMEHYVYDSRDRTYNVIDSVSHYRYESYDDYDSLMVAALKKRLT